jgi:ribosomal protein S18 acetylase RimI-like enzyme
MGYSIQRRIPTPAEYALLRKAVDWPVPDEQLIREGLSRSLYSICIFDNDHIIGMGRVIGDNAIYFHIQDVIVSPDYQGKHIGTSIMKELLTYIEGHSGTHSNIGLMCSQGREPFYRKFGFIERPNNRLGAGMISIIS